MANALLYLKQPLRPGVLLMRLLPLPAKLGLIGLMMLLPLLMVLASDFGNNNGQRRTAEVELEGAKLARQLSRLVVQLQAHRDLALRAMSGDASAAPLQRSAATELKKALADVDTAQQGLSGFDMPASWADTKAHIGKLAAGQGPAQRDELFAQHSLQVDALRLLLVLVGERSGLLLDPVASTYFLMDLAIERSVPWLESLAQARGLGASVLARGEASNAHRIKLMGQRQDIDRHLVDVAMRVGALERTGQAAPAAWIKARTASLALSQAIERTFTADVIDGASADYYNLATAAITAAGEMNHSVLAELVEQLSDRQAAMVRTIWLHMGGSLLGSKNYDYVTNDQSANKAQYDAPRRAIYLPVIRNAVYDFFGTFDFGDPSMVNAKRTATTVSPQALYLLNSPLVMAQAQAFAGSLKGDDDTRIRAAYQRAFQRLPLPGELSVAKRFLARASQVVPTERAWAAWCQTLLAANEFLYIE